MPLVDLTYPNYDKPSLTQEELLNVQALHSKWVAREAGGYRADFSYQDLTSCDLSNLDFTGACFMGTNLTSVSCTNSIFVGATFQNANLANTDFANADLSYATFVSATMTNVNLYLTQLCGAYGNGVEIKTISIGQYPCTYTDKYIQFSCQRHPIANWVNVTETELDAMDANAKIFHQTYFTTLEHLIVSSAPATESRHINTSIPPE